MLINTAGIALFTQKKREYNTTEDALKPHALHAAYQVIGVWKSGDGKTWNIMWTGKTPLPRLVKHKNYEILKKNAKTVNVKMKI